MCIAFYSVIWFCVLFVASLVPFFSRVYLFVSISQWHVFCLQLFFLLTTIMTHTVSTLFRAHFSLIFFRSWYLKSQNRTMFFSSFFSSFSSFLWITYSLWARAIRLLSTFLISKFIERLCSPLLFIRRNNATTQAANDILTFCQH